MASSERTPGISTAIVPQTRVKVQEGKKGGRVVIDFADLDDLERIYRAMTEPRPEETGE